MAENNQDRDGVVRVYPASAAGATNGTSNGARNGTHTGPVQDQTLLELIGRVINDVSEMADRQVELAKQEVREEIGGAIGSVKTLAIGAGIAAAAGLLLLIWAWTAFIWFFNWLGAFIPLPGGNSVAWLGWVLGFIVPAIAGWIAWSRFIHPGIRRVMALVNPSNLLPRTRATLKEDLEWVQSLRTPNAR